MKKIPLAVHRNRRAWPAYRAAFAGESAILAANNQFGIQVISTNVDYTETGNGLLGSPTGTLDTETGRVPGYALSISTMQDLWLGNDYIEAEYDHSSGNTELCGRVDRPAPDAVWFGDRNFQRNTDQLQRPLREGLHRQ